MSDDRELVNIIDSRFSISELEELCFELGIEYENIAGNTKTAKARELYMYCKRRSQIDMLMQTIHKVRPDIDLREVGGPGPDAAAQHQLSGAVAARNEGANVAPAEPEPPKTVYDNFDITIRPSGTPHAYRIEAKSPNGEASAAAPQLFPFEDDDYHYLARSLRDVQISEPQFAKDMGEALRKFLFPAPIQELFTTTLNVSRAKGRDGIRVRININEDSNELYQVPWEYCRDDKSFLAVNDDTPLVRYIPTNREPIPISVPDKVKILLAWATPKDLTELDVQSEIGAVKEALADLINSGKVEFEELQNATPAELFSRVSKNPPHIFHFIGHGKLKTGGGGAIALEGMNDKHVLVDGDLMLDLFQGNNTKLIILSACQSGATSDKPEKSSSSEAFMGLAPKLVWGGIPSVVAMQYDLPNAAAMPFVKTLYDFLAVGRPLDWALTKARLGLRFAILESPYWGIPVLFMRAPDGNIWA